MSTLAQGFALEALRVEPTAGLVSGAGGRERLDPKVMDVLVQMAEHAGQVVLREDLLARLWPQRRRHGRRPDTLLLRAAPRPGPRLGRRALSGSPGNDAQARLPPERLRQAARSAGGRAGTGKAGRAHAAPCVAAGASAMALAAVACGCLPLADAGQGSTATAGAPPHSIAVLPFLDMSEAQGPGIPVGRRDRGNPQPPVAVGQPARHLADVVVRTAGRTAGRPADRRAA